MADEVDVVGQEPNIPVVVDETFTLNVDEGGAVKDDAVLSYEATIAEQQSKIDALVAQTAQVPAQVQSPAAIDYEALAQTIAMASRPPQPSNDLDLNALAAQVDPKFYESPSKGVYALMQPVLEKQQAIFDAQLSESHKTTSKLTALQDADNTALYGKYGTEIEAVAKDYKGPTAYQQAFSQIKIAHMDEIIAEKVQAGVEAATAAAAIAQASKVGVPQATVTNAGVMGTAKVAQQRSATVTPAQKAGIDRWLISRQMNPNDAEDLEFAFNYLKQQGAI